MNVVLTVVGQVVVDDEGHLLDVDTTRQEIGGDEHATAASAELAHDHLALLLVHVAVLQTNQQLKLLNYQIMTQKYLK